MYLANRGPLEVSQLYLPPTFHIIRPHAEPFLAPTPTGSPPTPPSLHAGLRHTFHTAYETCRAASQTLQHSSSPSPLSSPSSCRLRRVHTSD